MKTFKIISEMAWEVIKKLVPHFVILFAIYIFVAYIVFFIRNPEEINNGIYKNFSNILRFENVD